MLKKLFIAWLFSLGVALAQTPVAVTGTIYDAGGNLASSGYVEFDISPQSSGVQYFVQGIGVISPQTVQCSISPTGTLVGCNVWGNDQISPTNTCYSVTLAPNGVVTNTTSQLIAGASYSLNSPSFCPQINITPQQTVYTGSPVQSNLVPVAGHVFSLGSASLPYSAVYADSLFVTNFPAFVAAPHTWLGLQNFAGGLTGPFTGTTATFQIINSVVKADQQAGADMGAKIVTACGIASSSGLIDATGFTGAQTWANDDISTACAGKTIQLAAGQTITIYGTYGSSSAAIILGSNTTLDCGGATLIQQAFPTMSAFARMIGTTSGAQGVTVRNCNLDGNKVAVVAALTAPGGAGNAVQNHAIVTYNAYQVDFHNNYIHDANGDGILMSGGMSPTAYNISTFTGDGTTTTITTSGANPFVLGSPVCVVSTFTVLDNCFTVASIISGTQFTVASTYSGTLPGYGRVLNQNVQNEVVGTGDGSKKVFYFTVATPQVVPGSMTVVAGANSYLDDDLGAIEGSNGSGSIDYATGAGSMNFDTAPGAGVQIIAAYSGGKQGFTSNFNIHDNTIVNTGRAGTSIISARNGSITHNIYRENVPFQPIHWEPDSGYEWARDIDVADNLIWFAGIPGSSISVGGQSNQGTNCSHVNLHDNTLIGGGILMQRCPYSTIHHNQIINATVETPITVLNRDTAITDNLINQLNTSAIVLDSGAAGILVAGYNASMLAGAPVGTGNNVVTGNRLYGTYNSGIAVNGSSNNTVANNEIYNINSYSPGSPAYAVGLKFALYSTEPNTNNVAANNIIQDNRAGSAIMQRGLSVTNQTSAILLGNQITGAISANCYTSANTGDTWYGNSCHVDQTISGLQPSTAAGSSIGSALLPFAGLYVGAAATNNVHITTTASTAARVFTLPDANSNPVQPLGSATANNWVQYIGSNGTQHLAQPAASNLTNGTSGTGAVQLLLAGSGNTDRAGQLTLVAGTISYTFTGTYATAPICTATDTAATPVAVQVTVSTTTLTLTVPGGANTDTFNYMCQPRT